MSIVNSVLGGVGSMLEKAGSGFEDFLDVVRNENLRNMPEDEPIPDEEPGIVERTTASIRKIGAKLVSTYSDHE